MDKNAFKWIQVALGEYGVSGFDKGINPRIVEYWNSLTNLVKTDDIPWCAAFMNWVIEKANIPSINSPYPKDYKNYGTALTAPEFGCIAVGKNAGVNGATGHVAFVVAVRPADSKFPAGVLLLGGNQDDKVSFWWRDQKDWDYRWPPVT